MTRYAALLRGVNVGRGPRVSMAAFQVLLTGLGFSEVGTLLNSGNAVFSAPRTEPAALAGRIGDALLKEIGTAVPVIVVTGEALSKAAAGNPFVAADPSRLLVAFAQDRAALRQLEPALGAALRPPDEFALGPEAAYLHCPGGIARSKAAEVLLGRLGRGVTTRNLATTRKLAQLAITSTGDSARRANAGGESGRR
jgi:uncharacterized protein (DUF1697 family)